MGSFASQVYAFGPGSPQQDGAIQKQYPGLIYDGTEPLGAWCEDREFNGEMWRVINASFVAALNGFQQVDVTQKSYAYVFGSLGVQAYYAPAGAAAPIVWIPLATEDGIFNVRDYGAVGDNVNNDAPAIQAAINACQDNGGGMLFFPAGQYNVETTLIITEPNNMTVAGLGISSTVNASGDFDVFYVPSYCQHGTGMAWQNINIQYPGGSISGGYGFYGAAINIGMDNTTGTAASITDTYFSHVYTKGVGYGLKFQAGGGNNESYGCKFLGDYVGVYLYGHGLKIHGIAINGGTYGLIVDGGADPKIFQCPIFGCLSVLSMNTGNATGNVKLTGGPPTTGQNDIVTIAGTAVSTPEVTGNTMVQQAAAIAAKINLAAATPSNPLYQLVSASSHNSTKVTITSVQQGNSGNKISLAATSSSDITLTVSGPYLTAPYKGGTFYMFDTETNFGPPPQTGPGNPTFATGTVTLSGTPTDGNTHYVSIQGLNIACPESTGASLAQQALLDVNFINDAENDPTQDPLGPFAVASADGINPVITLTAYVAGQDGNSVHIGSTSSGTVTLSRSGNKLSGGTDSGIWPGDPGDVIGALADSTGLTVGCGGMLIGGDHAQCNLVDCWVEDSVVFGDVDTTGPQFVTVQGGNHGASVKGKTQISTYAIDLQNVGEVKISAVALHQGGSVTGAVVHIPASGAVTKGVHIGDNRFKVNNGNFAIYGDDASAEVTICDNDFDLNNGTVATGGMIQTGAITSGPPFGTVGNWVARANRGFNPFGWLATNSLGVGTTTLTNNYGIPATYYLSGGTTTTIALLKPDGTFITTGLASPAGGFRLEPNAQIKIAVSVGNVVVQIIAD